MTTERMYQIARILVRFALGIAFLSAIADRFGLYGGPEAKGVSWGDWSHFVQFVAFLNWFLPKMVIPSLAVLETIIELALGVALLLGIYQRVVAWSTAALLTSFALTMTLALGIKAPLGYGVFSAVAAACLLASASVPGAAKKPAEAVSKDNFAQV
jgi:uncharacterized membrane protein YphA (DoxX/SURF4 family)